MFTSPQQVYSNIYQSVYLITSIIYFIRIASATKRSVLILSFRHLCNYSSSNNEILNDEKGNTIQSSLLLKGFLSKSCNTKKNMKQNMIITEEQKKER